MHGLVVAALLALSFASRPQKEKDPDAAVLPLAAVLRSYLEARATSTGVDVARTAVAQRMEERARARGGEPLRDPAELGRALWLARGYQDSKERGGKVQSATFAGGMSGAGLEYAYRLPRDYDPGRAYPLILSLPAEGEEPAEHIRDHWTLKEIQDGVIVVSPVMPKQLEHWDRVTVNGRPGGLCHVLTALRVAAERFALDFERIFVAGRATGVKAALAAGNHSPQRFAGIIGCAGDASDLGPDNFSNLPTLFTGGGTRARAFGEAARQAGHDNSRFQADGTEQDIWDWMREHPRRSHPERVVLVPGDPFPTRAYWLQVSPSAPECRAIATIERATNTIRIDAVGMAQVRLFLSDALVDLSQPVRVIANGVEQSAAVPRQLASFLDLAHEGISDPGAAYVAIAESDLTGAAPPASAAKPEVEAEFARFLAAAGKDVAKLWELHEWCRTSQLESHDARVLRRILRLAPEHAEAHAALGHVHAAGQWFRSQDSLARFRLRQDPLTAAAKGLVEYRSLWMHPDERALAVKGWVKDQETGLWRTPEDDRRLADGWVRQDFDWIPPEEAERVDEGLWNVGGEWFDLARANRRHAALDAMWRIPGAEVALYTTADRETATKAQREMERALGDLRRVFGAEPVLPLRVTMLRDEEQYDRFAFGDPDGRRLATHGGRMQVVHSAFFAESWFPRVEGKREFSGMGVCYWDAHVPNGDRYGVHAARLAAGLSYVDALDPSPKAVRKALASGPAADHPSAYEAEKQLPAWLRWGGAVYAERYFEDSTVAPDGDRWWTRRWSLENLAARGGLRELGAVLAFRIDPDDRDDALKLLLEAGLLVAFVVDGGCAPVAAEHAAFQKALAGGRVDARAVAALAAALAAHEPELRTFASH